MTWLLASFDAVLAGVLVVLAWRVLTARRVFTSGILFVVFSLAMALAWVRLGAVDIALAEAAVGGGLLGAMVLGVAQTLHDGARPADTAPGDDGARS